MSAKQRSWPSPSDRIQAHVDALHQASLDIAAPVGESRFDRWVSIVPPTTIGLIQGGEYSPRIRRQVLTHSTARALEASKSVPFTTAAEAARGVDLGIKFERTAMGEPTDRQALNIENILRDEVRQWVVPAGQENDG